MRVFREHRPIRVNASLGIRLVRLAPVLLIPVLLVAVQFVAPARTFAYGRGSYIRGMQQMMIRTAQAQQKMAEAIQKQQAAEEKAFMERFDTNHDGKITGKERGPANKYLREMEMGIDPDAKLKKQQQAALKSGSRKSSKSKKVSRTPKAPTAVKDDSKTSNP